jgi:hypothetical protein
MVYHLIVWWTGPVSQGRVITVRENGNTVFGRNEWRDRTAVDGDFEVPRVLIWRIGY